MLQIQDTQLLIIDIQGKLSRMVQDSENLIANVCRLVQFAQILEIPIILVEQNPAGLGSTTEEITKLLPNVFTISKMTFSAFGEPAFAETLLKNRRNQLLITGIEAHICVYQTVADLIRNGYQTILITDAISSRNETNRNIGIQKMRDLGAEISSAEMALFELQKTCDNENFKQLLSLVK